MMDGITTASPLQLGRRYPDAVLSRLVDARPLYNLGESYGSLLTWEDLKQLDVEKELEGLALNYGTSRGDERLRATIARSLGATPDQVLITAGGIGSLFATIFTFAGRGYEVLTTTPNFTPIFDTIAAVEATPVFIPLSFEEGFDLPVDKVEQLCSDRTRVVILTSPGTPSARSFSPDRLREAFKIIRRKAPQAVILMDEEYRRAALSDAILPSVFTWDEGVLIMESMSKCHGAPGLRIGWVASRDPAILDRLAATKFGSSICVGVMDETVARLILENEQQILGRLRGELVDSLDVVERWIETERERLDWLRPEASASCSVRLKPGRFSSEAVEKAFATFDAAGLQVTRASWYKGPANVMRLGFGYEPPERLDAALQLLSQLLDKVEQG